LRNKKGVNKRYQKRKRDFFNTIQIMATVGSEQEYQSHADSDYPGMSPLPNDGDPSNILSTMYADYPLKGIVHPHPHDVLCGRGKITCDCSVVEVSYDEIRLLRFCKCLIVLSSMLFYSFVI
jgi:hypothetical protein